METNPEQADHKTACNTTQDRKSEHKKGSKTRRILTLIIQYEQIMKLLAQVNETLH